MDKIESGNFGIANVEDYLELFLGVSNESEDVQEEVVMNPKMFKKKWKVGIASCLLNLVIQIIFG